MIRGAKVASGNRARGCADKENDPLHVRSNAHVSAGPSAEPLAGQRAQEAERSWKSGISRSSSVLMWARPTTGPPPQAVAGAGALPGGTMSGYSYMSGPGPHTPAGFLQATATGTLKGRVTGGLGGAAGHVLTALGRTVLGKLRPQPPAPTPFEPPRIWTNRHGFLTNGTYAVDSTAMRLHTDGNFGSKSQWWSYVDTDKATLDAAAYADEYGLRHGPKAKVVSVNGTVGACGEMGEETDVINLYRGDPRGGVRMVHGSPGH